jgi:hypothetical protein
MGSVARPAWRFGWALTVVLVTSGLSRDDAPDDGSFGLTEPIACREINGYEDYVVLPGAALTADEKLLVYFRPRHYKSAQVDGQFEAHLTQSGKVRRRGEKAVVWSKAKLLDYKVRTAEPPKLIFLRNTIALKGLKPGEYDFEIVLRDEVGRSKPAVRVLPFHILPSPKPARGADGPGRTSDR